MPLYWCHRSDYCNIWRVPYVWVKFNNPRETPSIQLLPAKHMPGPLTSTTVWVSDHATEFNYRPKFLLSINDRWYDAFTVIFWQLHGWCALVTTHMIKSDNNWIRRTKATITRRTPVGACKLRCPASVSPNLPTELLACHIDRFPKHFVRISEAFPVAFEIRVDFSAFHERHRNPQRWYGGDRAQAMECRKKQESHVAAEALAREKRCERCQKTVLLCVLSYLKFGRQIGHRSLQKDRDLHSHRLLLPLVRLSSWRETPSVKLPATKYISSFLASTLLLFSQDGTEFKYS